MATVVVATLILGMLGGGCSEPEASPYEGLEPSARRYVIPGSEAWGEGNPCADGASCSGPTTVDQVTRSTWLRVVEIGVRAGAGADRQVTADILGEPIDRVIGTETEGGRAQELSLQMWGTDVERVLEPLDDGFEVWVRLCDEALEDRWACTFVAFDEEERFAAMGDGMGTWFTVPMARAAAEAQADTGRAYLLGLITGQ